MVGVAAKYHSHPDSGPSPHAGPAPHSIIRYDEVPAVGTTVVCRKGSIVKTLLGGQYVMGCHVPCGSDVRDPGNSQVVPYSCPIVLGV
jgi:hypothetical protein